MCGILNVQRLLFAFSPWIMRMQISIQTYEWVRQKKKTEKSECLYLSHEYFMYSYHVIWHMRFGWLCSARSFPYATIAVFVDRTEQTIEIIHFEKSIQAHSDTTLPENHLVRIKSTWNTIKTFHRRQPLNDSTSTRKWNEKKESWIAL